MLGSKLADSPMDPNTNLDDEGSPNFEDKRRYRRLVGKLIYLTVTRPDITFAVSAISQYMHNPRKVHWEGVCRILRYLKQSIGMGVLYKKGTHLDIVSYSDADWAGSKGDRRSTSGYCTFLGGNLVTWRSKKQNVVERSSAEAEYRAMAHTACELSWLKNLLKELSIEVKSPSVMFCENQAAIYIARNPVFHERTKHIEVDCHFIRESVMAGEIVTPHIKSEDQVGDIFTKAVHKGIFQYLCSKLGIINIYAPA